MNKLSPLLKTESYGIKLQNYKSGQVPQKSSSNFGGHWIEYEQLDRWSAMGIQCVKFYIKNKETYVMVLLSWCN